MEERLRKNGFVNGGILLTGGFSLPALRHSEAPFSLALSDVRPLACWLAPEVVCFEQKRRFSVVIHVDLAFIILSLYFNEVD